METSNNIPNFGEELKQNPFSTPNGYFEQLPDHIQNRTTSTPKVTTWSVLKPQLAFVVGFVALVLMGRGMFTLVSNTMDKSQHVITLSETKRVDTTGNEFMVPIGSAQDNADDAVIAYLVDRDISDADIVQAIK